MSIHYDVEKVLKHYFSAEAKIRKDVESMFFESLKMNASDVVTKSQCRYSLVTDEKPIKEK